MESDALLELICTVDSVRSEALSTYVRKWINKNVAQVEQSIFITKQHREQAEAHGKLEEVNEIYKRRALHEMMKTITENFMVDVAEQRSDGLKRSWKVLVIRP